MSDRMTATLVIKALTMAIHHRNIVSGLIHHSDQDSQYTSHKFRSLLKEHNITASYSGVGNCYDNAAVESFFHTLKAECTNHSTYQTREHAKQEIFDYVMRFYNSQRKHSYIDYMAPLQFEKRLAPHCLPYWLKIIAWLGKVTLKNGDQSLLRFV